MVPFRKTLVPEGHYNAVGQAPPSASPVIISIRGLRTLGDCMATLNGRATVALGPVPLVKALSLANVAKEEAVGCLVVRSSEP